MNKYPSKLLLTILLCASAFGVQSQERPHRPALKEHKRIAVPIWTVLDTKDKPSSREMESPKPIPPTVPTVLDRIPPKKIGDLSCPPVDDAAKQACDNTCAQHPSTPCALLCTYRKNDEGLCVLWVECTSACGEIPGEDETPTGR